MRTGLFQKNRIHFKRLRSQKGASVIFALVGFMFAAMISFVVINAAYSAATRVKRLKYDEQSFLLAQSMSGIITDALAGSGNEVVLPDGSRIDSPEDSSIKLKYDGMTITYQYIEEKKADGTIDMFYNATTTPTVFNLSTDTGEAKKTFYDTVVGKASITTAEAAIQNMIRDMSRKVDRGADSVTETLKTSSYSNPAGEEFEVITEFNMNSSYSINAITTAKVKKGEKILSTYVVRMDASAAVRTDKIVCVGLRNVAGDSITAKFSDDIADEAGEELVKVSCYSVTWPADQMRSVYLAP